MRRLVVWTLPLAVALVAPDRAAQGDAKSEIAFSVGNASMTIAEVERRLRSVPVWQMATLGKTPDEVRRKFVETVLVPELLFEQEALRRKVDADPAAT